MDGNTPLPPLQVDSFQYGDRDEPDSYMLVRRNRTHFHIFVSPENLIQPQAPKLEDAKMSFKEEYMQMLDRMKEYEDSPEFESEREEFMDWILLACISTFKKLTTTTPHGTFQTLEDYYNLPNISLRLAVLDCQLQATQCSSDPSRIAEAILKIPGSDPTCINVPRTSARLVEMVPRPKEQAHLLSPNEIRVAGESRLFFKTDTEKTSVLREIDTLHRIETAGLSEKLRVSRLHSLVTLGDGSIVGMLLHYIESRHNLWEVTATNAAFPLSMRQKWMKQIKDIVGQLHDAGIIWGDVHPGNVLIDTKRDAWVVDFGGGCFDRWVDIEYYETIAGDFQGLMKLEKHMGLEQIRETILPTQKVLRYFGFCWWITMVLLLKHTAYLA
jgi:hypothetical protein